MICIALFCKLIRHRSDTGFYLTVNSLMWLITVMP